MLILPSSWVLLWVLSNVFNDIFCYSIAYAQSNYAYSSRIMEIGKRGVKMKPLSMFAVNDHANPVYIDTTVFNEIAAEPENCTTTDNEYCLRWSPQTNLTIIRLNRNCEKFAWITELEKPLSVVFDLEGVQLYGGAEVDNQSWPIQKRPFKSAYTTQHENSQAVLEPYWLDSKGRYIFVDDDTVPLFVEHNETKLQLRASIEPPYIRIRKNKSTHLKFIVCAFENVKIAHQHAAKHAFDKPTRVPDFRMVQYPIWSTWAPYKTDITEEKVLQYARAITENGFPNSALEIDDKWETCYGSLTTDKSRFPDMKRLVNELKERGFRTTLWIHQFVNIDCQPFFNEANESKYFVQSDSNSVSTEWWNGAAATIDFTNPNASKWWSNRLKTLQEETGLDSFKFDAGESNWLPQIPLYYQMNDDHPDTIVKSYVQIASQFGNMVEVRVGKGTQKVSPFLRMLDRETSWTGRLSLETLIPTLLQMSIVGYPFVLPDMIGGNAYSGNKLTEELYIRWLQVNTFMPALQFSLPPWEFGSRAVEITKKYIDLHVKYAPKIYGLMKKATKDGTPVNLPMWWVDPTDIHLYEIDSQFMLGEDVLVAPIVHENATTRDVYLPKGSWRDENNPTNDPIKGPTKLIDYKADLEILPYFTRIREVNDNVPQC